MLSKDVAIVNGMVRTKDSVRPGLVEVGKTLFWHGREGDVVSVKGDIIILDIDGEKYKIRASECESGTTGDSLKTKDEGDRLKEKGNYKGYDYKIYLNSGHTFFWFSLWFNNKEYQGKDYSIETIRAAVRRKIDSLISK